MKITRTHTSQHGDQYTILVFFGPETLKERFFAWLYRLKHVHVRIYQGRMFELVPVGTWPEDFDPPQIDRNVLNEAIGRFIATGKSVWQPTPVKGDERFL